MTNRVSEITKYEIYFDMWGISSGWIETIFHKLSEVITTEDDGDWFEVPYAGVQSLEFKTPSLERIAKLKKVYNQYMNLARKTDKGINHNR